MQTGVLSDGASETVVIVRSKYLDVNLKDRADIRDRDHVSSKRQRTTSDSPTPPQNHRRSDSQNMSDDEAVPRNASGKRIRGAAARNHREKEMREEKERQRTEAANKRKGRAERRRVDGKLKS